MTRTEGRTLHRIAEPHMGQKACIPARPRSSWLGLRKDVVTQTAARVQMISMGPPESPSDPERLTPRLRVPKMYHRTCGRIWEVGIKYNNTHLWVSTHPSLLCTCGQYFPSIQRHATLLNCKNKRPFHPNVQVQFPPNANAPSKIQWCDTKTNVLVIKHWFRVGLIRRRVESA
jgi:hypothetical protein